MPLPSRSRMTLRTVRNGEIFEAISESAGLFTVRWRAGALAVEGDSPEARTLRSLKLSPVPWRTQSASGLNSAFGLPRRHAMTGR